MIIGDYNIVGLNDSGKGLKIEKIESKDAKKENYINLSNKNNQDKNEISGKYDSEYSRIFDELERLREEANDPMKSISNKLQMGKKLTEKEIKYLSENNPQLYKQYKAIMLEREMYKQMLKGADSKGQVRNLHTAKIMSLSREVGSQMGDMRIMHIQDEYNNFVKSNDYKRKPNHAKKKGFNTLKMYI